MGTNSWVTAPTAQFDGGAIKAEEQYITEKVRDGNASSAIVDQALRTGATDAARMTLFGGFGVEAYSGTVDQDITR